MNRFTKVVAVAALLGVMIAPAQANAQTLAGYGSSFSVVFDSDGAGGATTTSSFLLAGTSSAWYDITYTDCCLYGDQYEIYADGSLVGTTVVSPPMTSVFSWAAYGGQTITLAMPVFGGGLPAGSSIAFSKSVPEPAAMLLVVTGLLGMAVRRRRDEGLES
jgi:hypothetical protein